MLKFFEIEARFPRHVGEYPPAAIAYVARQVDVDPGKLAGYGWIERASEQARCSCCGDLLVLLCGSTRHTDGAYQLPFELDRHSTTEDDQPVGFHDPVQQGRLGLQHVPPLVGRPLNAQTEYALSCAS
jgi:hypothetical protein